MTSIAAERIARVGTPALAAIDPRSPLRPQCAGFEDASARYLHEQPCSRAAVRHTRGEVDPKESRRALLLSCVEKTHVARAGSGDRIPRGRDRGRGCWRWLANVGSG